VPTDEWERGYSAGYRAAHRTDVRDITTDRGDPAPKKSRRTRSDPKLSKAMKEAYKKSHKKNGDFKKGWDRSKMLKEAHRLRRKMK
jgi:hypothetical protein